MSTWGAIMDSEERRSWTECLRAEEKQFGGPSPNGNSWYSVFEQCPYLWWVTFKKRMRPVVISEALEIGGLYHECRARYSQKYLDLNETGISDADLDLACEQAMFDLVNRAEDIVPQTANQVRRLLRGWLTVYGPTTPRDDRHLILSVEELIETNRGWPYSTRLDCVLWDEELNGPAIKETKTAGRLTEELLAGYTMDSQFLGQQYCWRHSPNYQKYGPLKGFVVDLAIKTQEMRFTQERVPIIKSAIRDWERQRRHTYRNMLLCEAEGYWPRIRTNCVKYARRCPLTQHCSILGRGTVPFPGYAKKTEGEY